MGVGLLQVIIIFIISLSSFSSERIVSTVPSLSEALYELRLSDSVVGVSKYCLFDESFCSKEKVGTSLDISYERILKLKASTVILSSSASEVQVKNLSKLNIKTLLLAHDRLDDIYSSIKILGKRFSREQEARELVRKLDTSLSRTGLKLKDTKVLFLISSDIRDGKVVKAQAAGSKNFYSDILEKIGLSNILKTSSMSYPEVGRENLISLKYDYIIEIFGSHNDSTLTLKKEAWKELGRSKKSSFKYVPLVGNYLFVPGPSVWKIAQDLKNEVGKNNAVNK